MSERAPERETVVGKAPFPATHPPARLRREERTIAVMIELYCRDHHGAQGGRRHGSGEAAVTVEATSGEALTLCADCSALLLYARRRLAACRYGAGKPTCAHCPTHCYKPTSREQVREVMRYSGPRMLRRHPVLAVAHLLDGRRRFEG